MSGSAQSRLHGAWTAGLPQALLKTVLAWQCQK
jgi:hypothetical protein